MNRHSRAMRGMALIAGAFYLVLPMAAAAADVSDADIRKVLIQQSIATYAGSCPCPYNVDRAGRQCGRRSAYSKPGGQNPLCYSSDVTDEMVARYRNR